MTENNINRFTHDAFVKKFMSRKEVATEFFAANLPQDILKITDLSSFKQEKSDFIDNTLGHGIVDLLYSVKFNNQTGYVSVLLEHQSTPDKLMTFRIQKYMLRICDAHLKKHPKSKLPVIYPIIFYTGKTKYTAPLSFWELFSEPKLAKQSFTDQIQLLELRSVKDIDLRNRYHSGIMMYLMSKIYQKDILPFLDVLLPILQTISKENFNLVEDMLYYILENAESQKKEEVLSFFEKAVSEEKRGEIMTIANELRAEGLEQGIQQGIQQGMQQSMHVVTKNLLKKGMNESEISSITGLSITEIVMMKNKK
jgi:predicted transposase/invertase (TIGR01784 family)